jgi:hypothetical protein
VPIPEVAVATTAGRIEETSRPVVFTTTIKTKAEGHLRFDFAEVKFCVQEATKEAS